MINGRIDNVFLDWKARRLTRFKEPLDYNDIEDLRLALRIEIGKEFSYLITGLGAGCDTRVMLAIDTFRKNLLGNGETNGSRK